MDLNLAKEKAEWLGCRLKQKKNIGIQNITADFRIQFKKEDLSKQVLKVYYYIT